MVQPVFHAVLISLSVLPGTGALVHPAMKTHVNKNHIGCPVFGTNNASQIWIYIYSIVVGFTWQFKAEE